MLELKAIKLKKLDFDLQKMGDILSFEGPFLSHFRDERGSDYLMNWVDIDENFNRWLLIKINLENLTKYFTKKISLLQAIKENEFGVIYFIDINSEAEYKNIWLVSVNDIPNEYSPNENSFFDEKHADKYAKELIKENKECITLGKNSFINKAVKQIFPNLHNQRNIFLRHNHISPMNFEPNSIDEITTIRAMYFPLLVHYSQDMENIELRNLLRSHSHVYSTPHIYKKYLNDVRAVVIGHKTHLKGVQEDAEPVKIWEEMMHSTYNIIQNHPNMKPLYNEWIHTIEGEYNNIQVIVKNFENFKSSNKVKSPAVIQSKKLNK